MNADKKNEQLLEKRQQIGQRLRILSEFLELFLALLILIGIILRFVELPEQLKNLLGGTHDNFTGYVDYIIDSVIGVELVHLLCQPNLDNVVEILLVAITREIITLEGNAVSTILYVLSLAILFVLRRFVFVDKLDRHDTDFTLDILKKHRQHKKEAAASGSGSSAEDQKGL